MNDNSGERIRRAGGSRLTLVALFLVFVAPAAGAWLWFNFGSNLSTRNHGVLYEPARPLVGIPFDTDSGDVSGFEDLRTTWTLAYVGDGRCAEECLAQIDKLGRVRLSQAENVKRIKPLYLSFERQSAEIIERIRSLVPTAVIGRIDAGWRDALREKLLHDGESAKRAWNRVYLIDPIGNLVLSYAIDADPAKMRKDLSRLLRASQIG